jgi:excisionase family DNA binding protein
MEIRKKQLITMKELGERWNLSKSTLSRLIAKGAIPYYRIGLKIMFSEDQISEYLSCVEHRN